MRILFFFHALRLWLMSVTFSWNLLDKDLNESYWIETFVFYFRINVLNAKCHSEIIKKEKNGIEKACIHCFT